MGHCIRMTRQSDMPALLLMMKEHALFEGADLNISRHHQQSQLTALPVTIFVVTDNEQLVGYMSVIKQFSTWDLDWYLYLDCLYLSEHTRGLGLGGQLMGKLKSFAKEHKIKEIQWQTPKENLPAIEFYQKQGAINKHKQRFFWFV